ncbi:MAG: ATP-binding cassette domain-containing protein [Bifidobacteriaceae bacterium]|nr:ATP-binding cassette domain-containing protein [Bifidobacteriaceae bacterium]
MALISLKHVTKRYKGSQRPALSDVSVDIDRGDFVFLVGASGAGKSTFLSLLLREEMATSGEIHVAGHDLRRLPNRRVPEYRREIGFVFQDYKLLMNKTVRENVAFALEVIGTRRSQIGPQVDRALRDVGLESKADKRPTELSGGEMQRVSSARAYVNQPKIIIADEPTVYLDPTTSVGIMRVLNAINLTGTTIVMATHNEEIVNSMSKRVLELNEGRLVRDEANGRYDSARYFPDAQAEREAALDAGPVHMGTLKQGATQFDTAQGAREQVTINASALDGTVANQDGVTTAQQSAVGDTANGTANSASNGIAEDEGIAKLEQAIHSGNTGVYGKAFENVEDTLTWGKGLRLDEYAAAQKAAGKAAKGDGTAVRDLGSMVVENPQQADPNARFRPAHAERPADEAAGDAVQASQSVDSEAAQSETAQPAAGQVDSNNQVDSGNQAEPAAQQVSGDSVSADSAAPSDRASQEIPESQETAQSQESQQAGMNPPAAESRDGAAAMASETAQSAPAAPIAQPAPVAPADPQDAAHVDTLAQLARGTVPRRAAQAQPVPLPPPAPPMPGNQGNPGNNADAAGSHTVPDDNQNTANTEGMN